ncbi:MAG: hypothetical protein AB7U46_12010 [Paenirhodobacter sp.]|uniref:hypothetical protein n=1 Tax=Paenirhodobacter sp. TaxID=1965326 RepID=UPI003D0E7116
MKRILICLAAAFLAAPACAQQTRSYGAEDVAGFSCNPNGAVMQLRDGGRIYLGRSCDASVPGHGAGHWWYAAHATVVVAPGFEGFFNFVEPPCKSLTYCAPPK